MPSRGRAERPLADNLAQTSADLSLQPILRKIQCRCCSSSRSRCFQLLHWRKDSLKTLEASAEGPCVSISSRSRKSDPPHCCRKENSPETSHLTKMTKLVKCGRSRDATFGFSTAQIKVWRQRCSDLMIWLTGLKAKPYEISQNRRKITHRCGCVCV